MPGFDPRKILEAFTSHDVEFVLIGGIAVQSYVTQRLTVDIDFAVTFSRENRERIAAALRDIDARMIGPNGEIAAEPPSAGFLGAGDMWLLSSRYGKVDVLAPPGRPGWYGELRSRANEVKIDGMTVPIASREDLIAMKRQAGRPQDLEDIKLLESLDDE